MSEHTSRDNGTRRQTEDAGIIGGASAGEDYAYGAGSDRITVGLIGCGGRGTGAAVNSVESSDGVEITAMADLFEDRLKESRPRLEEAIGDRLTVTDSDCYVGFDAYQRLIRGTDVDYVILATPPGYRPIHIREAVEAGKHVFAEKPVAVDSAGVRSVIESAELADEKELAFVAGTQYRHHSGYIATLEKVHNGAIGEIVAGQIYNNGGELWLRERQPGMSDMEWQCRNWYYFTWLSGDYITEQTIHDIDIANWIFQGPPEKAVGTGGRQVRVDPSFGHIYDHFAIEYTYPNGARLLCMDRQQDGAAPRTGQWAVGTAGTASLHDHRITGEDSWTYEQDVPNPYVQEHADLITSIRSGNPLNEGRRVAESTLTAIMGREAAYTGQEIHWDEILEADLDLVPETFGFGPAPFPPVAVPGRTPLNRSRENYYVG